MSPAPQRPLPPTADYVVPGPRSTDAIGVALGQAYRDGEALPNGWATLLHDLDRVGKA